MAHIDMPSRPWGAITNYLERESWLEASGERRWQPFCGECGSEVFERCPSCSSRVPLKANYCGQCGKIYPWTEGALAAARELTDSFDLSADEKVELKSTFEDLTVETNRTPLAVSRFTKIMTKLSPIAQSLLQKTIEVAMTEEVKHLINLIK